MELQLNDQFVEMYADLERELLELRQARSRPEPPRDDVQLEALRSELAAEKTHRKAAELRIGELARDLKRSQLELAKCQEAKASVPLAAPPVRREEFEAPRVAELLRQLAVMETKLNDAQRAIGQRDTTITRLDKQLAEKEEEITRWKTKWLTRP